MLRSPGGGRTVGKPTPTPKALSDRAMECSGLPGTNKRTARRHVNVRENHSPLDLPCEHAYSWCVKHAESVCARPLRARRARTQPAVEVVRRTLTGSSAGGRQDGPRCALLGQRAYANGLRCGCDHRNLRVLFRQRPHLVGSSLPHRWTITARRPQKSRGDTSDVRGYAVAWRLALPQLLGAGATTTSIVFAV